MPDPKPKFSALQGALVGTVAALAAVGTNRLMNPRPDSSQEVSFLIGYWVGVAIFGAILGVAVAAILARVRR